MTNYTVLNGLPSQTVYNTLEDQYGFLWITTDAGVSRFDGTKFINYTTDHNLGANEVLELFEDSKGRIWFLPFFGDLSYYYKGQFYSPGNSNLISSIKFSKSVRHMIQDSSKYLYIFSHDIPNQMVVISPNDEVFNLDISTELDNVKNLMLLIYLDEHKIITVYISKIKTIKICKGRILGIHKLDPSPSQMSSHVPFNRINILHLDKDGLKLGENNNSKLLIKYDKIIDSDRILVANVDKFQNLWMSYSTNKTYIYPYQNGNYTDPKLIIDNIQTNLCLGESNNAWFCSSTHGLIKISLNNIINESFNYNSKLLDENIVSAFSQKNGTVWVGYSNGYVTRFKDNTIKHFNLGLDNRQYNRVIDIMENNNETPYFITDENGCIINQQDKVIQLKLSKMHSAGKGLCKSVDGQVLFGFSHSLSGFEGQMSPTIEIASQKYDKRRFSQFINSSGKLYLSTADGVMIIDGHNIKNLSHENKKLSCRVNKFFELPNCDILLLTYGDGIIVLRHDTLFQELSLKDGLSGIICRGITFVNDTNYVATQNGISIIGVDKDKYKVYNIITSANGLISDDINSVFIKDNKIFAASSKGLSVIPRNSSTHSGLIKNHILIQSFLINGLEKVLDSNITLAFSNYHFQISYITPNLNSDNSLIYRYKLSPLDNSWNTTKSNSIDLSNLKPNDYKLSIQSKFNQTDWSEPAEIHFTILQPFYNTWIFRISALTLLLIGIYQIFKYLSKIKYEKALQDARMKEAVHNERDRIASDIHDDLGADLTNILILTQRLKSEKNESKENLITTLENRLNEIINKMNEVIWSLNYSNDRLNSLMAYIRSYVQTFSEQSKLNISLSVDPSININTAVSALIRRNVFLTIKEFINNSVKHSEAKNITINLYFKDSCIFAELFDDGLGIEYKENFHLGNGILNMKKRINALDGSIQFISNIPKGLKLIFKVPVK